MLVALYGVGHKCGISDPDNDNRSYQHKKNLNASGIIDKNNNNQLVGTGKDYVGRKVEFITNKIN